MMNLAVDFRGVPYSVDFNEDSTVLDLKNQLKEKLRIPVGRQDLTFQGYSLHNEAKLLLDYRITPGSLLVLHQLPLYEVNLSYPDGKTSPIRILHYTTVLDAKMAANTYLRAPIQSLDLLHGGLSLEDETLVRSCEEIDNSDVLKLVVKFEITVIGRDNQRYPVSVHQEKTVKQVKLMLQRQHDIPAKAILLCSPHSGYELEDDFTLREYGITDHHRGLLLRCL